MNFYPPPPVIKAELYVRIPGSVRCIGRESEWRGGFARQFQHIFLEGPVADELGNLYVVDVPYGRILRIDPGKNVTVSCEWDGEPNGLVGTRDGTLLVADYKQVLPLAMKFDLAFADVAYLVRGYSRLTQQLARYSPHSRGRTWSASRGRTI